MKALVVKTCESLYKLARKSGKRTTSNDSERSEGEAVGYGSRNERTHYTLKSGAFIIRVTEDRWVRWSPTTDSNGTTRNLEILKGQKIIFFASCNGPQRVERFTAGDERYAGAENVETQSWQASRGKIPVKYLSE